MPVPSVRLRDLVRRPEFLAVAVLGIALRWWVLLSPYGLLNGDEAVTGLSALEISQGHLGILIPESYYTALVESYLFAPFIQFFGAHIVPLKLMGVTLWFGASLVGMAIGRRLGGARSAVMAFSLLWLIPGAMMVLSTRAYLGYPGGTLVSLSATLMFVTIMQDGLTRRRAAVAGFLVGLAFMMHPILPGALAPAALVVTYRHRRAIRDWYIPAVTGLVVGCAPWLWWNAFHGFGSLEERDVENTGTYTGRLGRYVTGLLPRDLGLMDPTGQWIHAKALSVVIYVVVLAAIVWAVISLLWRDAASRVVAVPAVAAWLALGVFKHSWAIDDGRYGILPMPFVVVTLAVALGAPRRAASDGEMPVATRWLTLAAVAAWLFVLVLPYQREVIGTDLADPNAVNATIVETLNDRGITLLSGEYMAVLPVSYATGGRIATRVFYPFPRRYPRLEQRVDQGAPENIAVLFYTGAARQVELPLPMDRYDVIPLPGLELYVPRQDGA